MAHSDAGSEPGPSDRARELSAAADVAATGTRSVVLVEGASDRAALSELAARRSMDLHAARVEIIAIGGAGNFARCLRACGPHGLDLAVAGLYDRGETADVRRGLAVAGIAADADGPTMATLGFHVCNEDLEGELIRALGIDVVERVIVAQGDLRSLRLFRQQPAQRNRDAVSQLRRFMGTTSGRKIAYARHMVAALDLAHVPRSLDAVLAAAVAAGRSSG